MELLYANITNLSIQVILSTGLVIFHIAFLVFEEKILRDMHIWSILKMSKAFGTTKVIVRL
jgi:hypothetical protein